MANEQNLRPSEYKLSREEAKRGGINSGKSRRQQKSLKAIADMLGNLEIKGEKNKEILRSFGIKDEDMINDTMAMYQLQAKVLKGDPRATELWAKIRKQLTDQVEFNDITPPGPLSPRKAKERK